MKNFAVCLTLSLISAFSVQAQCNGYPIPVSGAGGDAGGDAYLSQPLTSISGSNATSSVLFGAGSVGGAIYSSEALVSWVMGPLITDCYNGPSEVQVLPGDESLVAYQNVNFSYINGTAQAFSGTFGLSASINPGQYCLWAVGNTGWEQAATNNGSSGSTGSYSGMTGIGGGSDSCICAGVFQVSVEADSGYRSYAVSDCPAVSATGISSPSVNSDKIKIFPNPVQNEKPFFVTLPASVTGDAQITISDLLGRTAYQTQASANESQISVTPSGLAPGDYVVNVLNHGKTYYSKIQVIKD